MKPFPGPSSNAFLSILQRDALVALTRFLSRPEKVNIRKARGPRHWSSDTGTPEVACLSKSSRPAGRGVQGPHDGGHQGHPHGDGDAHACRAAGATHTPRPARVPWRRQSAARSLASLIRPLSDGRARPPCSKPAKTLAERWSQRLKPVPSCRACFGLSVVSYIKANSTSVAHSARQGRPAAA
jgi:hypothetical protein